MKAVLELNASRFQADMAVAMPLSSTVCRCNGSMVVLVGLSAHADMVY